MWFVVKVYALCTAVAVHSSCNSIYGAPKTLRSVPRLDRRIQGGVNVNIENYPYQVSLQICHRHFCGGVIISQDYVLSAAHCIVFDESWYTILAGSSYSSDYFGVRVGIQKFHVHPNYNSQTKENDIAVIRLSSLLSPSRSISPIRLASYNDPIPAGSDSIVTGWGSISNDSRQASPMLQAVTIPIVDQKDCIQYYQGTNELITSSMICAGLPERGRNACRGDSGGPLMAREVLVGLVSFGGCTMRNHPTVFTSIPYFRPYIRYITGF